MKMKKRPIHPAESEINTPISVIYIYLSSGGTPDKGVIERTANALKID